MNIVFDRRRGGKTTFLFQEWLRARKAGKRPIYIAHSYAAGKQAERDFYHFIQREAIQRQDATLIDLAEEFSRIGWSNAEAAHHTVTGIERADLLLLVDNVDVILSNIFGWPVHMATMTGPGKTVWGDEVAITPNPYVSTPYSRAQGGNL